MQSDGEAYTEEMQIGAILTYLQFREMSRDGLKGYVKLSNHIAGDTYVWPTDVAIAYFQAYRDEFGEGVEVEQSLLALVLGFVDSVDDWHPDKTAGELLADYCESILNPDGARPRLTRADIVVASRSVGGSFPEATIGEKINGKAHAPLPDQQSLPFSEPEPEPEPEPETIKKYRSPARNRSWVGHRITYKANDQRTVIGDVTRDIAERLWFTDEQGEPWGRDEGVDKARCKPVGLSDPAVMAGKKPGGRADVVFELTLGMLSRATSHLRGQVQEERALRCRHVLSRGAAAREHLSVLAAHEPGDEKRQALPGPGGRRADWRGRHRRHDGSVFRAAGQAHSACGLERLRRQAHRPSLIFACAHAGSYSQAGIRT